MFDRMKFPRWKFMLLLPLALVTACASQPGEFTGRAKTSILVMTEDSDPTTLPRSSTVHTRVKAGLQAALSRQGFRILDEQFAETQMGWRFHDRQNKNDLIEAAKLMRQAGRADTHPGILVLYRLHSRHRDNGFATVVRTRLSGEIYDIAGNRFLDGFELAVAEYSAPADCDQACLDRVVGAKAGEISSRLGAILGRKLALYSPGAKDRNYKEKPDPFADKGIFSLTLTGFNTEETLEVMRVMTTEFPGYQDHELVSRQRAVRHYRYETKASRAKMEKWITILLTDMGFDPDRDVDITVEGNRVTIAKNETLDPYQPPRRKRSGRFQ